MFLNVNLRLIFSTLPYMLPSHVSSPRLRITLVTYGALQVLYCIVLYCKSHIWNARQNKIYLCPSKTQVGLKNYLFQCPHYDILSLDLTVNIFRMNCAVSKLKKCATARVPTFPKFGKLWPHKQLTLTRRKASACSYIAMIIKWTSYKRHLSDSLSAAITAVLNSTRAGKAIALAENG